jgi:hypothetical protein
MAFDKVPHMIQPQKDTKNAALQYEASPEVRLALHLVVWIKVL